MDMDSWDSKLLELKKLRSSGFNVSFDADSDSFFSRSNSSSSTWATSIMDLGLAPFSPIPPVELLYKKYESDVNYGSRDAAVDQRRINSPLPSWAVTESGAIRSNVTLRMILDEDVLLKFAIDKNGCHFLQSNYPADENNSLRTEIFYKLVENKDVYLNLCQNLFGNFFLQRMAETANRQEQQFIVINLRDSICEFSLDKCACRVVQNAIKSLDVDLAVSLAKELCNCDIGNLCIDRNGNHVVQIVIDKLPMEAWDFIAQYIVAEKNLVAMCENKYGCRVVQCIIEKLVDAGPKGKKLCSELMNGVIENCARLTASEYANYVIQHTLKAGGSMSYYRDHIIEHCLLGKLLSMSQEKYSSHVVEIAFCCAPEHLLKLMMKEIFEGYIPDPTTRMDAVDILLFHQYGNYVIQKVISLCQEQLQKPPKEDWDQIRKYFLEINARVDQKKSKLCKFSSGKRIITVLTTAPWLCENSTTAS